MVALFSIVSKLGKVAFVVFIVYCGYNTVVHAYLLNIRHNRFVGKVTIAAKEQEPYQTRDLSAPVDIPVYNWATNYYVHLDDKRKVKLAPRSGESPLELYNKLKLNYLYQIDIVQDGYDRWLLEDIKAL
ncbi:hypothetical protein DB346_05715 [Verrucomicrobia bacterium LW23]|nr:hypothetical protein DB346_05715 [Verrucomicrobia bacterium LW23]